LEKLGSPTFKGAEAFLYRSTVKGLKVLVKYRLEKAYRLRELDKQLRRSRTINEARNTLIALEAGVNCPAIILVDPETYTIIVEEVEGRLLRDVIEDEGASTLVKSVVFKVGCMTAKLHSVGIAHGDLTTSNIIVTPKGEPYIIDFGLSHRTRDEEDYAIDIHLFLRSLESTHPEYVEILFTSFIKGYESISGRDRVEKLLKIVERIRLMGRYIEARRRSVWSH